MTEFEYPFKFNRTFYTINSSRVIKSVYPFQGYLCSLLHEWRLLFCIVICVLCLFLSCGKKLIQQQWKIKYFQHLTRVFKCMYLAWLVDEGVYVCKSVTDDICTYSYESTAISSLLCSKWTKGRSKTRINLSALSLLGLLCSITFNYVVFCLIGLYLCGNCSVCYFDWLVAFYW